MWVLSAWNAYKRKWEIHQEEDLTFEKQLAYFLRWKNEGQTVRLENVYDELDAALFTPTKTEERVSRGNSRTF